MDDSGETGDEAEQAVVEKPCTEVVQISVPQLNRESIVSLNNAFKLLPFSLTHHHSPLRVQVTATPVVTYRGDDALACVAAHQSQQRAMLVHLLACNNTLGGAYATLNYSARWASGGRRSDRWLRKQLEHADRQLTLAFALGERGLALRALVFRGYALIWRSQFDEAAQYFQQVRALVTRVETIEQERLEILGMIDHAEIVNQLEREHATQSSGS